MALSTNNRGHYSPVGRWPPSLHTRLGGGFGVDGFDRVGCLGPDCLLCIRGKLAWRHPSRRQRPELEGSWKVRSDTRQCGLTGLRVWIWLPHVARALRIEYPAAIYHVMARGNQGQPFTPMTATASSGCAPWASLGSGRAGASMALF